jgi:hypothetical protein
MFGAKLAKFVALRGLSHDRTITLSWREQFRYSSSVGLPSPTRGTEGGDEGERQQYVVHRPVSTTQRLPSKKTARMGDEGKAVGGTQPTALLFAVHELEAARQAGRFLTWINVSNGDWLLGL